MFVAHTRLYLTRLFCKIRFVQQRVATNGSDGQRTKCLIRIRRSKTFLFMITSIFICDALIRVLYPQSGWNDFRGILYLQGHCCDTTDAASLKLE